MILTDKRKAILWLNAILGLSSARINKLLTEFTAEELYENPNGCARRAAALIGDDAGKLKNALRDDKPLNDVIRDLDKCGASFIIRGDKEYPQTLENIEVPPSILYYKGDITMLACKGLAVVGTREPSLYGRQCTEKFVEILAKMPITIISGLARGVDSVAHRVCLNNNGKTIAVIATGIDKIYPANNESLAREIAEKGLLITEYPIGTPALGYYFPERNRIISALSEAVLVTEAGLKSGSLITAEYAIKQGKELFVIPSAINSPRGAGTNKLLKSLQGAIVLSPDDIVEAMGVARAPEERATIMQLDFTEERILEALSYSEIHFDDLVEISGLGVSDLSALLLRMELTGLIRKLDNNYYGV